VKRLIVVLAVLVAPASAHAASAEITDKTLHITYSASASEDVRVLPQAGGRYLVRVRRERGASIGAGAGCAPTRPRELRCGGDVEQISVSMQGNGFTVFAAQNLGVPLAVVGGNEADLVVLGDAVRRVVGSRAPVDVQTGGGRDSIIVNGTAGVGYTLDGGSGRDNLEGIQTMNAAQASFTLRGGDGPDRIVGDAGADDLEGGPGDDELDGRGGADTLLGGAGNDTASFVAPVSGEPRLTVSLDGERNDGQPGQNALVGADVENVTLQSPYEGPVPGGNTLIGNDGPNRLIGAGTMRGLGGDDVLYSVGDAPNEFDGGDGNDRISARVYSPVFGQIAGPDEIACGSGDDVVLTDPPDAHPADCEHFNLGPRVVAATATVGPGGRAAVKIRCDDIVPCRSVGVSLFYKDHRADTYSGREGPATLQPGQSAVYRDRLNRWLGRPGRFRKLIVTAVAEALVGGLDARTPRVITLIRPR
jgi:Ca2+-binding RTX toxin-like protein